MSTVWQNRWPLLRWGVFALALAALGSALYAWLPPEPRWAVRGEIAALGLTADGKTFRTATMAPADLPNRMRSPFGFSMPGSGPVQFWDVETGREVLSLLGKGGPRWKVAFSADGKRLGALAAQSADLPDELVSIDLVSGRETRTTIEHHSESCALTVSAHGELFLLEDLGVQQETTPLFLYDADSLRLLTKVAVKNRWPRSQWADDGKALLTYSVEREGDSTLRRIGRDGDVVTRFKGAGEWLALSLDSKLLATESPRDGDDDIAPINVILLWDTDTGKPLGSIPVPDFHPRSAGDNVLILPDNKTLILTHGVPRPGDLVGAWDVDAAKWLGEVRVDLYRALFFPEQNAFASLGAKGAGHVDWFRAKPFGKLWQRDWPGRELHNLTFVPGSDRLVALTGANVDSIDRLQLLNGETGGICFDLPMNVKDQQHWIMRGTRLAINERHFADEKRSPFWEFVEEHLLSVFTSARGSPANPTTTRIFDVEDGTEHCRIDLPGVDLYEFAPDGRSLFLYQEAGSGGEAVLSCYDVPPRHAWAWIIGVPLVVGAFPALLRAGWLRIRQRRAASSPKGVPA